jgi:hypothetical protein
MVLHLCERLEVPLSDRNTMLAAAGFAPQYPHHRFDAPEMAEVREMVEAILRGHLPHPALALNRRWELQSANEAAFALLAGVAPALLEPPVNVLRLSLHPEGLAPRIANLAEWRSHLLHRLDRDVDVSADPHLAALRDNLRSIPLPPGTAPFRHASRPSGRIAIPLRLRTEAGTISLLSTTTVFGTASEVTLADLTIEAFYPVDDASRAALAALTRPRS